MIHLARVFQFASVALLLSIAIPAAAQKKAKDEVLLSFSGVLKGIGKKVLIIEPDPDNQMTFLRSKRTRFFDAAGGTMNGDALKQGTPITVQSATKLNGELEAVRVSVIDPDQSPIK